MKVRMSDDFKVAYKRLKKRHRSLEADFERKDKLWKQQQGHRVFI